MPQLLVATALVVALVAVVARAAVLPVAFAPPAEVPALTVLTGRAWDLEVGGELNVTLAVELFYVLLMTTSQLSAQVNTSFPRPGQLFQYPTVSRYAFRQTYARSYILPDTDRYVVCLISLGGTNASVTGQLSFYNPSTGQLTVRQGNVMPTLIFYAVLYAVACATWLRAILVHRDKTTYVQHFITSTVFARLAAIVFDLAYYTTAMTTGYYQIALAYVSAVFTVGWSSSFLIFMLLTSLGLSIVRLQLQTRERNVFTVIFVVFLLFLCMDSFCFDNSICPAFELGFYVVMFLITFAVVVALNANVEWLRIAVFNAHILIAPVVNVKRAVAKIRLFLRARVLYFVYLVFPVFLLFVDFAIVDFSLLWLPPLIEDAVSSFVIFSAMVLFRPQSGHFHLMQAPPAPAQRSAAQGPAPPLRLNLQAQAGAAAAPDAAADAPRDAAPSADEDPPTATPVAVATDGF